MTTWVTRVIPLTSLQTAALRVAATANEVKRHGETCALSLRGHWLRCPECRALEANANAAAWQYGRLTGR